MRRPPRRRDLRSGSALVIVLTMVTIVSVLVLVYLGTARLERSATQSYSARMGADQIALGGIDRLEQDFLQEIRAGSNAQTNAAAGSPVYYKPAAALSMIPARYSAASAAFTNLIRTSASSGTAYTAAYPSAAYPHADQIPANLAVASSTGSKALDGSYTSLKRWQKPQLLVPGETMPAPDWVLMTRSGPTNAAGIAFGTTGNTLNNRDAANPNYVNGRYAYVVYDEGGLIDATVAGAPGAAAADDVGNRGSLALVPLTNSILTSTQAAALAAWRNPASGVSQSAVTNYVYNLAATNGFLHVQPGDNTFLSRQDLISYATYAGITAALPYLGTFNRAVNAPAFSPANATAQNPDLLTLRFLNGGTVNSGGTLLKSRTVQAGDFLLTRRFPLGRLSWVGYNGLANGANATDVWRAFGLVWDTSNNAWAYVRGGGASLPAASAVKTSIETLAQVALESPARDPDFFELLQAGILQGSLGQTGGAQASFNASSSLYLYGGSGDTSGYDSVQAYQLVQIGVNIIDQARADNFPTAIRFGPDSRDKFVVSGGGTYASARTFYGVKNLPYINRIIDTAIRWVTPPPPLQNSDKFAAGGFPGKTTYQQPYVGCWQRFELWNPHQTNAASALNPGALRIVATGQTHGWVYTRTGGSASTPTDSYTFRPGVSAMGGTMTETTLSPTTGHIDIGAAALQNFAEPKVVGSGDVTAANCTANYVQDGTLTTGSGTVGAGGTSFVGIYIGSVYAPDYLYSAQTPPPAGPLYASPTASATTDAYCVSYCAARINPSGSPATDPGVTYAMQYQDPANVWHTYGVVKNQTSTSDFSPPAATLAASNWTLENSDAHPRFAQRIDPRTDRFSTTKNAPDNTGANPLSSLSAAAADQTIQPAAGGAGYSSDTFLPYGATAWFGKDAANTPPTPNNAPGAAYYLGGLMENTASSTIYYKDPDGTPRRGDSAYDSTASQDGHPGVPNASFTASVNLARPVFLNRPFRSVGELGYVDRDLPWKTLDFFTKESGDAVLLDLFSVSDADVVAGTIDLNTRNTQALAEVLGGIAANPDHVGDSLASPLGPAQGGALAAALVAATATRPLLSRSELVTEATDPVSGETILSTTGYTGQSSKVQREAAIRALSESGNPRTWNLLVDIIAQSGRYPQGLAAGASLDNFLPEGEKRYWLHIAIDRYTGKIVDRFLEPVRE